MEGLLLANRTETAELVDRTTVLENTCSDLRSHMDAALRNVEHHAALLDEAHTLEQGLRSELAHLDETKSDAEGALLSSRATVQSLRDELADNQSQLQRICQDLHDERERYNRLVRDYEGIQHKAEDYDRVVEGARRAVEQREEQAREIGMLNLEVEGLRQSLDAASQESHHLQEVISRETNVQLQLELAIQAKADAELSLANAQASAAQLQSQIDDLQVQVQKLKQRSADQEVKNVHLTKTNTQLEEDNDGLYMSLEAKQQELELVSYAPILG